MWNVATMGTSGFLNKIQTMVKNKRVCVCVCVCVCGGGGDSPPPPSTRFPVNTHTQKTQPPPPPPHTHTHKKTQTKQPHTHTKEPAFLRILAFVFQIRVLSVECESRQQASVCVTHVQRSLLVDEVCMIETNHFNLNFSRFYTLKLILIHVLFCYFLKF